MPHLCSFVPPHVLANIARVHAREGLEPTAAQHSAIVSEQLRRERRNFAPDGVLRQAVSAGPQAVPKGLTVPPTGTAGRLIYDDKNQWNFDVKLVRGEGDPAVAGRTSTAPTTTWA